MAIREVDLDHAFAEYLDSRRRGTRAYSRFFMAAIPG